MCKYHTVFLTQTGQVYTCGHGHGGRLGHDDEETCVVCRIICILLYISSVNAVMHFKDLIIFQRKNYLL